MAQEVKYHATWFWTPDAPARSAARAPAVKSSCLQSQCSLTLHRRHRRQAGATYKERRRGCVQDDKDGRTIDTRGIQNHEHICTQQRACPSLAYPHHTGTDAPPCTGLASMTHPAKPISSQLRLLFSDLQFGGTILGKESRVPDTERPSSLSACNVWRQIPELQRKTHQDFSLRARQRRPGAGLW